MTLKRGLKGLSASLMGASLLVLFQNCGWLNSQAVFESLSKNASVSDSGGGNGGGYSGKTDYIVRDTDNTCNDSSGIRSKIQLGTDQKFRLFRLNCVDAGKVEIHPALVGADPGNPLFVVYQSVVFENSGTTPVTKLDTDGWSVFTPSADTRKIFVSSEMGNDANDGLTEGTPVKTIGKGVSLLRSGFPDWLLLKKNNVWIDQSIEANPGDNFSWGGRSAAEPMLLSSYGTGARPLIKTKNSQAGIFFIGGSGGNFVAVSGLEFYSYQRDPKDPGYVGAANVLDSSGIFQYNDFSWQLVEDCKFSFYGSNLVYSGPTAAKNLIVRRNVIVDAYNVGTHSHGFYADGVSGIVIEENLFDHNGWNASVAGADATVFNHNLNIEPSCGPVIFRKNISANASSYGIALKAGGSVTDSLFVRDPIAVLMGATSSSGVADAPGGAISGNVITEGNDITSDLIRGIGIWLDPSTTPIEATTNVVFQGRSLKPQNQFSFEIDSGAAKNMVAGNYIYQWNPSVGATIQDQSAISVLSANVIDQTGSPGKTLAIGDYDLSLGGNGTFDNFLIEARKQRKDFWRPQYAAASANSFVRLGFGLPAL